MSLRISLNQKKLLKRYKYIFKKLVHTNAKDRKVILKNAPKELFKALDLVFKLLAENRLPLPHKQEETINKHKRLIRSASKLKTSAIKAKLLQQRGGALPVILSAILPIIGSLVKAIF